MDGRTASRSGRIVTEIRRRIETGELAPGDRVPSTREITREWGVAMATATKALTELRHEGLVRAVPGVGTVVAAPPRRPGRPARRPAAPEPAPAQDRRGSGAADPGLSPERIVEAALGVADAEGLAAVSMRRVATVLGVATMSLYRHVADKDALVVRMMEAVFARTPFPDAPPDDWRDRLTVAARLLWQAFRRHPWLAPALSVTRPQLIPSALPFTEWVLGALDGRGLDNTTVFSTHLTLLNYIRGTAVNIEAEEEAQALTGMDSDTWMDAQEPELRRILAGGRLPTMARLLTSGPYDLDLDELFEFGLRRFLDGVAALLAEAEG
ncbi:MULTISPECIES: TetR/AcrR family transcriptional regulator C-terminal domain-containing protein [Streptomyces]|uniref:TetR/AcrR family transcriptional regulator C-terminal domain-containing protein n=1 Tax=Streptomyces TaxID=1883 RepID=UPI00163CA7E3|nr:MULTISPECIES: TetR/AcrR family transcriptional regulator C-terminal domain-containing protein [Streptomyces]MBC2876551.1 TetR/AcrR family transcriptional regulator C-terminal domain-containing protein [Streptomyces sp. TYQ1024]UBI40778.1 TetR/AcrR family transcriptional regulator C-terminal domain-containing protein [Streptomyces mobaraensis]